MYRWPFLFALGASTVLCGAESDLPETEMQTLDAITKELAGATRDAASLDVMCEQGKTLISELVRKVGIVAGKTKGFRNQILELERLSAAIIPADEEIVSAGERLKEISGEFTEIRRLAAEESEKACEASRVVLETSDREQRTAIAANALQNAVRTDELKHQALDAAEESESLIDRLADLREQMESINKIQANLQSELANFPTEVDACSTTVLAAKTLLSEARALRDNLVADRERASVITLRAGPLSEEGKARLNEVNTAIDAMTVSAVDCVSSSEGTLETQAKEVQALLQTHDLLSSRFTQARKEYEDRQLAAKLAEATSAAEASSVVLDTYVEAIMKYASDTQVCADLVTRHAEREASAALPVDTLLAAVTDAVRNPKGVDVKKEPEVPVKSAQNYFDEGRAHYDNSNYSDAFPLYLKASEMGHAEAQNQLGFMYENGLGSPVNLEEAAKWYRKGAENGDRIAMNNIGIFYLNGDGVAQSDAEAAGWFIKAAEAGYPEAQATIGWLYQNGRGVAVNLSEAIRWYKLGAEGGSPRAQSNLGYMYERGLGTPIDYTQATVWYKMAADQGNATALNNLAYAYQIGRGVPKDAEKAINLFEQAVSKGNELAMLNLAWMYEQADGVPENLNRAAQLYQQASAAGSVSGTASLGWLYMEGRGVPQDNNKAFELLSKAADQGHSRAQNNLGVMYEEGRGRDKDLDQAFAWYQKSADAGDSFGQYNLARFYESGWHVPKDTVRAIELYQASARQGYQGAQDQLKRLNSTW